METAGKLPVWRSIDDGQRCTVCFMIGAIVR